MTSAWVVCPVSETSCRGRGFGLRTTLPPISAWKDDSHEIQRGWKILEAGTEDTALAVLVEEGVEVLLSLLARGLDENPYAEFESEPDHFDAREIHLLSLKQAWQSIWADMTVEQWVRWLAVHWGIQRHLSVALRKMRGERRDTFRIRPLEQELRVVEVPPPAATVPRLGKAFQILRDLWLLTLVVGLAAVAVPATTGIGAASAQGPTPPWRILVLIYEHTDFSFTDGPLSRRVVAGLSAEETAFAASEAAAFVERDIPVLDSHRMRPSLEVRIPWHNRGP